MTKKVTGNDLKNLIKEVLSENINISIDKASWGKAKKSAGLASLGSIGATTGAKGLEKLLDLTGVDGDETDLTDDDLKRAKGDTKTTADKWFTNSSKRPSGFADLDAYVAFLGGGPPVGGTYFYKDSNKVELKDGFHAKNNPKKGKMGAIAKGMQTILSKPGITNGELSAMLLEVSAIFKDEFGTGKLSKAVADVRAAVGSLPPGNVAPNTLKTKLNAIAAALRTVPTQDITAPVVQDVGSNRGRFPPGLIVPLNDLFSGKTDFDSRLRELERVSKLLVTGTTDDIKAHYTTGMERQFLRDITITDYFATIFREIDDRSLGYYFESLGALLAGGEVQGATGGAGDFTVATGPGAQDFEGSSKAVGGGSAQALSGFIPGKPVLYLVAQKVGTSPSGRTEIPIKAYTVQLDDLPIYDGNDNSAAVKVSSFPATNAVGKEIKITKKEAGKAQNGVHGGSANIREGDYFYGLTFAKDIKGSQYTLYFANKERNQIKTLKDILKNKFGSGSGSIALAFQGMQEYFDELKTSQAAIKDYIGSDDPDKGSIALTSLTRADDGLEQILVKTGKKIAGSGASRVVTTREGKVITASFLKKLIQENFKK